MTDAMLAVMRGPDRDAREANVPRLRVADDGTLEVGLGFGGILALHYCSSALSTRFTKRIGASISATTTH
jgi:hypothetical protein